MRDTGPIKFRGSNMTTTDYLSSHAFFKGLDDDFIRFLSESATEIRIKAGESLFKQGTRADKFYLLRSGQVVVQVPALMGPTLDIQTLGEDQILGWSWLIAPYRWSFGTARVRRNRDPGALRGRSEVRLRIVQTFRLVDVRTARRRPAEDDGSVGSTRLRLGYGSLAAARVR